MLNTPSERVKLIRSFTAQKMITFDYTGAFDVSEVLTDELQQTGADAITNHTITIKSNFQSGMINLLTIGLANARVFAVQGDLVDVEGDTSSLLDAHEVIAISGQIDELPLRKADSHTSLLRLDEGFTLVKSTPSF